MKVLKRMFTSGVKMSSIKRENPAARPALTENRKEKRRSRRRKRKRRRGCENTRTRGRE